MAAAATLALVATSEGAGLATRALPYEDFIDRHSQFQTTSALPSSSRAVAYARVPVKRAAR